MTVEAIGEQDDDDIFVVDQDVNRIAFDVVTALESSLDGFPIEGENTWFWRTFFQFRLPSYLQRVGQEGKQRERV